MSMFNFSSNGDAQRWQQFLLKAGVALLSVATVFLLVLSINEIRSGRYIGKADKYQNTINVSGEGEVFAIPDTAQFSFTVQEESETVAAAQESVTERANTIINYLEENSVTETDIKTTGYSIQPRYEFQQSQSFPRPPQGERVLVGYEVAQTTQVKVRDTGTVGDLLSGLGQREVSRVSSISFTIEDESAVQAEARQQAIADAQEKAQTLADQLGVRLGDVVSFSESTNQPRFMYDTAQGFGGDAEVQQSAAPEISPGENRIMSNVNLTYEIR